MTFLFHPSFFEKKKTGHGGSLSDERQISRLDMSKFTRLLLLK